MSKFIHYTILSLIGRIGLLVFIGQIIKYMDFSGPGITYILLLIPMLFALAVTGQGIYKVAKSESGGAIVLGFGIVFLALIGAAYFFFIR